MTGNVTQLGFFSTQTSPTNWSLDKACTLEKNKKKIASRAIVVVSIGFSGPSSLKQLSNFVVKLFIAFYATTFGQIPALKKRTWARLENVNLVSKNLLHTWKDLAVHIYKAVMFLTFSPLCCLYVGLASPKICKIVHDKLCLTQPSQKNDENNNLNKAPKKANEENVNKPDQIQNDVANVAEDNVATTVHQKDSGIPLPPPPPPLPANKTFQKKAAPQQEHFDADVQEENTTETDHSHGSKELMNQINSVKLRSAPKLEDKKEISLKDSLLKTITSVSASTLLYTSTKVEDGDGASEIEWEEDGLEKRLADEKEAERFAQEAKIRAEEEARRAEEKIKRDSENPLGENHSLSTSKKTYDQGSIDKGSSDAALRKIMERRKNIAGTLVNAAQLIGSVKEEDRQQLIDDFVASLTVEEQITFETLSEDKQNKMLMTFKEEREASLKSNGRKKARTDISKSNSFFRFPTSKK